MRNPILKTTIAMRNPEGRAMQTPTHEAYSELETAFDHFNLVLFGGKLARPMFTLQRERRTYGYCSRQRFLSRTNGVLVDEIAMNPAYFSIRSIRETLSTEVHEMVHQWQFHHGTPGRRGYHNKEWAKMMEAVGLMPSKTGKPGGAKTGEQMTHYIITDGPFDKACKDLLTRDFTLSWVDKYPPERPAPPRPAPEPKEPGQPEEPVTSVEGDDDDIQLIPGLVLPPLEPLNRSNRVKYYCDECKGQAWGKRGMHLFCGGRTWSKGEEISTVTHSPVAMRLIELTTSAGLDLDQQQHVESQDDHAEHAV
ncbi:SprT-like domain-containing protein [Pseudomonas syringae group genomosp. 3]|uniref:SprT-like domain-containing protein n=1 Tax=Pseudomonas syringae group genomosp. 3 TaxID=251701 RepID=UPI001E4A0CBD|nr:SprT-like domain-containing protein [Pseudomonas syringae group genomosp. 3]